MDATGNMLTGIIKRLLSEKADKLPFSEVRKNLSHSLVATTLAEGKKQ